MCRRVPAALFEVAAQDVPGITAFVDFAEVIASDPDVGEGDRRVDAGRVDGGGLAEVDDPARTVDGGPAGRQGGVVVVTVVEVDQAAAGSCAASSRAMVDLPAFASSSTDGRATPRTRRTGSPTYSHVDALATARSPNYSPGVNLMRAVFSIRRR